MIISIDNCHLQKNLGWQTPCFGQTELSLAFSSQVITCKSLALELARVFSFVCACQNSYWVPWAAFVFNSFHDQFPEIRLTIFYQNISSICSLLWDAIFAQLVIVTVILRHLKTISHPPWQNHDQIDWLYYFPSSTSWSSSSMFSHRPALVNAERVWKKILKFVDKNPITGQLRTSLKKWLSIQVSCQTSLQFA